MVFEVKAMSYKNILDEHGVTVKQWEERIAAEYIGQLWMKNFKSPPIPMPWYRKFWEYMKNVLRR